MKTSVPGVTMIPFIASIKKIAALFLLLFFFSQVEARVLRPKRNTGNGTSCTYNNVSASITLINDSVRTVQPGDTILFDYGTVYAGIYMWNIVGSVTDTVVLMGTSATQKTLIGGNTAGQDQLMFLTGKYFKLVNLHFTGRDTTGGVEMTTAALKMFNSSAAGNWDNSTNYSIERCEFNKVTKAIFQSPEYGNAQDSILIQHNYFHGIGYPSGSTLSEVLYFGYSLAGTYDQGNRFHDVTIRNNIVDSCYGDAFQLKGGNFYVYNNTITRWGYHKLMGRGTAYSLASMPMQIYITILSVMEQWMPYL